MEKREFIELIEKYFGQVIKEQEFAIVYSSGKSFGDFTVILQSTVCRVKIYTDRGQVNGMQNH
jgi:hypothetical protein